MGFPEDISVNGHWVDHLFWLATGLTAVAFALVLGVLVYFLVRYRARPGRLALYTHGNSKGALTLTLLLAAIVFLGIDVNLAWQDHHAWEAMWGNPPDESEAVVVQVMPEQFAWNFRYAGPDGAFGTDDDITEMNTLRIPVHEPVILQLKAKDVLHSIFLPNLRIKQDCLPGMVTAMHFVTKKTGRYEIACAELCGLGHYYMKGRLHVLPRDEYDAWLDEQKGVKPDRAKWSAWGPSS